MARLIVLRSETAVPNSEHQRVHDLFEEQAKRSPGATAVEYDGRRLSYAQLNARANQLAHYLRKKGVGADRLVAICMERSLEMVVALVGALKAGGAYVPLDPSYPADCLERILEDAAPQVVLTQQKLSEVISVSGAERIQLDERWKEISGYSVKNLSVAQTRLRPEHLVHVIYTSGSTGRAKGIAMSHRSMVNLIEWHRRTFGEGEGVRASPFKVTDLVR